MSTSQREKSGKGVKGGIAFTEELARQMADVLVFQRYLDKSEGDEFELISIRFRAPQDENGDWLGVCKAWVDGKQMIGFSSGASFNEVLLSVVRRIVNKSLRWKDDSYA